MLQKKAMMRGCMRTVYCLDIVNSISKEPESYKFGPNKGSQKINTKPICKEWYKVKSG